MSYSYFHNNSKLRYPTDSFTQLRIRFKILLTVYLLLQHMIAEKAFFVFADKIEISRTLESKKVERKEKGTNKCLRKHKKSGVTICSRARCFILYTR